MREITGAARVVYESPTRSPFRMAFRAGMLPPLGADTSTRWRIRGAPAQVTVAFSSGSAVPKRR